MAKNTIKVERAKKNITQKELAKQIGSSRQAIHQIECGKAEPRLCTAMKIAKFFGVKVQDIFSPDEQ